MLYDIKTRLKAMGRTQRGLLEPLRARGLKVDPNMVSDALNGHRTSPAYSRIVEASNEIVTRWEALEEEIT
jgi:hypothetical protein